jgi:hypothetical protein
MERDEGKNFNIPSEKTIKNKKTTKNHSIFIDNSFFFLTITIHLSSIISIAENTP